MSFGRLLQGRLGVAQPQKTSAAPHVIRNHSETLERKLALGAHVALALRDRHGDACFDGVAGLSADGSDAEVRYFPARRLEALHLRRGASGVQQPQPGARFALLLFVHRTLRSRWQHAP